MNEQVKVEKAEKTSWVETEAAKIVPPRAGGDNKLPEVKEQKADSQVEDATEDDASDIDAGLEPKGKSFDTKVQKALHKERERAKQYKAEAQQLRDEFTRANERLEIIQKAWEQQQNQPAQAQNQAQTPAQTDPEPNKEADVVAWFEWRDRQREREIAAIRNQVQQTTAVTQQQQMVQEITNSYAQAARQFSAQKPDFGKAYEYLYKELDQDLQDRGVADAETRRRILMADELQFAAEQRKAGRNAAEIVYNWAVRRGYKAPETQSEGETDPAPALVEVAQQNRRNEAAKSLSGAGGRAPSNLTLRDIANMDKEDFLKHAGGKNWDKLLRSAAR